jgi:Tol biopolymer transport system component/sugar lactone lactonase YvrE
VGRGEAARPIPTEPTITPAPEREAVAPAPSSRSFAGVAPDLKPVLPGYAATSFYLGTGHIDGLACRPDGSLLVAVESPDVVPQGVYVAHEGDLCDLSDAYTTPGPPFDNPDGIMLHRDGRVFVADNRTSTIWVIPSPGAQPQVLTKEIVDPYDIVVAPPSFDGPNVNPGDFLVCANGFGRPDALGLYVVDQETLQVRRLAGWPEIEDGVLHLGFGPDDRLYAMLHDGKRRDGVTILTISPDGEVTRFLDNHVISPGEPHLGPMAVHPAMGDVYFGMGWSVYRVSPAGGEVQLVATGGVTLTHLEFSPDGSALYVSDAGGYLVVKIAPAPANGQLYVDVRSGASGEAESYFMDGTTYEIAPAAIDFNEGDISPRGDMMAYVTGGGIVGPRDPRYIWKARTDGSDAVNLTALAGLGGTNCIPRWSPDGTMIAFQHSEPKAEQTPCEAGFHVWGIGADGTGARPLIAQEADTTMRPCWAHGGRRVICERESLDGTTSEVIAADIDGGGMKVIPNVGTHPDMSPDGSRIVSMWRNWDVADGRPGMRHQLRLTNVDGTDVRVLVEQFVSNSDISMHFAKSGFDSAASDALDYGGNRAEDLRAWVGPLCPRWSPAGDRIAFLAAMPFDPNGPTYKEQVEVWVYELATAELTRLTNNRLAECRLSWGGGILHTPNP